MISALSFSSTAGFVVDAGPGAGEFLPAASPLASFQLNASALQRELARDWLPLASGVFRNRRRKQNERSTKLLPSTLTLDFRTFIIAHIKYPDKSQSLLKN